MDEFVVVGAYGSEMEADLVVQRLASVDIQATTRSDTVGGMFPSMELATGGIEVLVPRSLLAVARRELGQTDGPPSPSNRRKPSSRPSEQAPASRRFVAVTVFLVLTVIILAAMLAFLDSPIP